MITKIVIIVIYLAVIFYLGFKGWQSTKKSTDYMLAGRQMNPFIMAMSYGATFVSTSAIIGFGGAAGLFGFPLLWLTLATIVIGVFIAMVFFGKRTRRMGLALESHTFPELLGRRYDSRFIQGFAGGIIFLFIPIYAAAVLIGISRMMEISFGIPYGAALIIISLILALYVVTGGMKAVMYTDAFQGVIMAVMMLILVISTYVMLGGVTEAHQALTDMVNLMPEKLVKGGMIGWTQGTRFGTPLWLVIYTTIVYGVGVGVLAQPQLAVRFMTVPSDRELNRAVLYGGIFIPLMTGVAFTVGALSNAVFYKSVGKISIAVAGGNMDKIIPMYIEQMMPPWFSSLFLLAMLAAGMSTLSSQYHVGGTALGRDFFERFVKVSSEKSVKITRIGVSITLLAAIAWAWVLPPSIIARATAFFFGLCAASFLPIYLLGLYWKGMTKKAAKVSLVGGFSASMFWLLFVHAKEAVPIGLCQTLFGQPTLVTNATKGSWIWLLQWVDPNVVALPISLLLAIGVSFITTKIDKEHLKLCWSNI
ncbi:solute:Na+ symporter, SSS family [Maridesulfovibrio ferrireducens]|uniref:Solute:Na+ symporter, SSS family n=1 Tax=Maridesulfovibrio ferrireducens TaxID=246191 RepID=A0A1G9EGI5_9BACT|nr:sodium:solute symporter family protein [Maridesulfovibrio ferrireducens]SDK75183.1 solute:Na+ symporter, SSS family [Maridesulfovibrio ferrireducens]